MLADAHASTVCRSELPASDEQRAAGVRPVVKPPWESFSGVYECLAP